MWTYTCIIEFFAVIGDSTCMKNYTRVIYECKETNEKLEARESVYVCVCVRAHVSVWVGMYMRTKKERKEMKVKERMREREKKEREWVSKRKRNAYTRKK